MNTLIFSELSMFSEVLGWTLIHSLWQIGLIAIALKIVLNFVPQRNAVARYNLSLLSLLAIVIWTTITFTQQLQGAKSSIAASLREANPSLENMNLYELDNSHNTDYFMMVIGSKLDAYLPLLSSIWLLGIIFLLVRLLLNYRQLYRLDQQYVSLPSVEWLDKAETFCKQLEITRKVKLLLSERISEPITFRHFRPVVLLPVSMMTGLTAAQIETLLLHELAHIRRHDYLINLFQSVLEILFFFHPAVWWISRIVREEREHCCDDLVLQHQQHPMLYAEALLQIQANHHSLKTNLAMSAKGNHKPFTTRIQRLFGKYPTPNSIARGTLAVLLVMGVLSVLAFSLPNEEINLISSDANEMLKDTLPERKLVEVVETKYGTETIEIVESIQNGEVVTDTIITFDLNNTSFEEILEEEQGEQNYGVETVELVESVRNGKVEIDTMIIFTPTKSFKAKLEKKETEDISIHGTETIEVVESVVDGEVQVDTIVTFTIHEQPEKPNEARTLNGKAVSLKVKKTQEGLNIDPIYIVDGVETSKSEVDQLDPNTIKSVRVYKDAKAVERFGEKGRNGVVEITTKHNKFIDEKNDAEKQTKIAIEGNGDSDPLFVVDGKILETRVNKIEPNDIESITVLKGEQATNKYGAKGIDGVVEITTKKAKKLSRKKSAQDGHETEVIIKKAQTKLSEEALIILNGKEYNGSLDAIDSEDIISLNVLKGKVAIEKYGDKGENGVIEVRAKISKSKKDEKREKLIGSKVDLDKPLIVLDGKVYQDDFQTIDQKKIATISVLKDEKAIEKYGEKGKDGVVEITSKKGYKATKSDNDTFKIFPNPSDDVIQIRGELKQDTRIKIEIWDMKGALVQQLINGNFKGRLGTKWDGSNATPGTYIVKITMDGEVSSKKVVIK